MRLDIYKNQKEIEKTYEIEAYDLMYGTVEDMFNILESVSDGSDDDWTQAIMKNRGVLNNLIRDVFPEITDEELRKIKVKDLIPFFIDLFGFVNKSFGTEKN